MFRIDNDSVIDATIAGGPARYINHSCQVNKVISKVFIFKEHVEFQRKIQRTSRAEFHFSFLA